MHVCVWVQLVAERDSVTFTCNTLFISFEPALRYCEHKLIFIKKHG